MAQEPESSGGSSSTQPLATFTLRLLGPQSASAETREEQPGGSGAPCRLPRGEVSLMVINGRQPSVRFLINPENDAVNACEWKNSLEKGRNLLFFAKGIHSLNR